MDSKQLEQYTRLYKGEKESPFDYKVDYAKNIIWMAEREFCESKSRNNSIDKNNIKDEIEGWVEAFVGKWNPYEMEDIMRVYRSC